MLRSMLSSLIQDGEGSGTAGTAAALQAAARAGVVPDGFSFTRTSAATDIVNGVLTDYAAGEIRAANGWLIEEQRTNFLRNGEAIGATVGIIGSGGALPTNWTDTNTVGLTREIVGSGTENGFAYVDLKLSGTPTAGDYLLFFESNTQITASNTQQWCASAWCKFIAGTLNAITNSYIKLDEYNAGSSLASSSGEFVLTGNFFRAQVNRTLNNASTTKVVSSLRLTVTANPIDITLRISSAQLELGALMTSYIRTTTAAATRNHDTLSIPTASIPGYSATQGSLYVKAVVPNGWGTNLRTPSFITLQTNSTNYLNLGLRATTGRMIMNVINGGSQQAQLENTVPLSNDIITLCGAFTVNDFVACTNGEALLSDVAGTLPTCSTLYIGSVGSGTPNGHCNTYVKEFKYFNKRIPNSEVTALGSNFGFFGQISTRSSFPNANTAQSGALAGSQVQQWSEVYFPKACKNPKFQFANYRPDPTSNNAQQLFDGEYPYTLTAQLDVGGTIYRLHFDDGVEQVVPVGSTKDGTATAVIPAGTTAILRWLIRFSTAPVNWPWSKPYNYNKYNEFGSSLTDRTGDAAWSGGAITASQYGQFLCPIRCIGYGATTKAVIIFGDSIGSFGSNDGTFGTSIGFIQRALDSNLVPWINCGASGMWAGHLVGSSADEVASRAKRFAVLTGSGIEYAITNYGANDVMNVATGAAAYANLVALQDILNHYGIKLICCTADPRTNAANNAEPTAGLWTKLNDLNDLIRSNNGVGHGFFDARAYAQDKASPNLWRTDMATSTTDGIHPDTDIHTAQATALALALRSLLVRSVGSVQ